MKLRLQGIYEQAYPELHEIIHLVLDDEEKVAVKMSTFPHLLLPDLVEAHIARLNLRPPVEAHAAAEQLRDFVPALVPQLAYA